MEAVHRFYDKSIRSSRIYPRVLGQVCALGLLLIVRSSPAQAQAQKRASSANSELLLSDEQTVTSASKAVQKVSDAPAAVTVITEEQITSYGATSLLDILRYATGVDVIEPNGSVADVSIRGSNALNANRLLVMIDGRSIYQDLFGNVAWHFEPLLLSRIKRIEIVRGPGSALYGANAFNGIINIITRTPAELAAASEKTSVRLLTGERNTQNLELQTTGGNAKDWSFSLGAAYNHTDGLGDKGKSGLYDRYSTPTVTFDAEKRLPQGTLRFAAGNAESVSDFIFTATVPRLAQSPQLPEPDICRRPRQIPPADTGLRQFHG